MFLNLNAKKTLLLLAVLVILLVGLSVASAVNVTKTSDRVSKKSVDTSKAVKNFVVDKNVVKNTTKESVKAATSKTKTKVTISNVKKQYEVKDQLQVKAKLTDNKNKALKNQYVAVKVNKNSFKVKTDKKGVAITKKITLNNVGKYTITANFAGTKKYAASKATKTTKTTKMTTKIVSDEQSLEYSKKDSFKINFLLLDNKNTTIKKNYNINVKINDKNKKIKVKKGKIIFSLNNSKLNGIKLKEGKNKIIFSYLGDKESKAIKQKFSLIIDRNHSNIKNFTIPKVINWGTAYNFSPVVGNKKDGDLIKVIINNTEYRSYEMDRTNGNRGNVIPAVVIPNMTGKYSIYAEFMGDNNRAPAKTKTSYFDVVRDKSTLSLDVKDKYNLKEPMFIQSRLVYENGQNITGEKIKFSINNRTFTEKTVDGIATLKYTPKVEGNYSINVVVKDFKSKNITKKDTNSTFIVGKNIVKRATKIEIEYRKNMLKNHNQTIYITVYRQPKQYNDTWELFSNAKVDIISNNKNKTMKTSYDGRFSFESNDSFLSFSYAGNEKYSSSHENITIKLHDKADYSMKISYLSSYHKKGKDYYEAHSSAMDMLSFSKSNNKDWHIRIYFKNKDNLPLNKGNLDVYLDNIHFYSLDFKEFNQKYIYMSSYYRSGYLVVSNKYASTYIIKYLEQGCFDTIIDEYFDYNIENHCYIDKNNTNLNYSCSDIEIGLLPKFKNITYVYTNEDGVKQSISHLINGTKTDNKQVQTTFEVVC